MSKLIKHVNAFRQRLYQKKLRKKINNKTFTLITNNCIGGVLYHQLGLKFNSPTINNYLSEDNFLIYIKNIEEFIDCDVLSKNTKEDKWATIVSNNNHELLFDAAFVHYSSFDEGRIKWIERSKRINLNNLFIVFDYCNEEEIDGHIVNQFNKIHYKKVLLYNNNSMKNSVLPSDSFGIDFGKEYHPGKILETKGKKYYFNQFDFVKWLNGK